MKRVIKGGGLVMFVIATHVASAQQCAVNFTGSSVQTFSLACGGISCTNLNLGKDTPMESGDVFIFDHPVVTISGNFSVNAEGGKIIIPLGVTVNVVSNFRLDSRNTGCSVANPCTFEIEVLGNLNIDENFDNKNLSVVWSGSGTVSIAGGYKNSNRGCTGCARLGCPNFNIDTAECKNENAPGAGSSRAGAGDLSHFSLQLTPRPTRTASTAVTTTQR